MLPEACGLKQGCLRLVGIARNFQQKQKFWGPCFPAISRAFPPTSRLFPPIHFLARKKEAYIIWKRTDQTGDIVRVLQTIHEKNNPFPMKHRNLQSPSQIFNSKPNLKSFNIRRLKPARSPQLLTTSRPPWKAKSCQKHVNPARPFAFCLYSHLLDGYGSTATMRLLRASIPVQFSTI